MAFGNISTLFLPSTFASAAVGGTRIASLRDVVDAAESTNTVVSHPSNTVTRRAVIPYQTSTIGAPRDDYGFAISPADMGGASGARRFYPTGDHVYQGYAAGGNTLGNNTYRLTAYRVGASPSFTKTLIGGPASTTGAGLGAAISITLSLPEIIFEPGETILYALDSETNPGALQGSITFSLGTSSLLTGSVVSRITTPKLGVLADTTGTATGTADVAGVGGTVLGTVGTAAGTSTTDGQLSAVAAFTGTAEGSSVVDGQLSAIAAFTGTAEGSSVVDGRTSIVLGTVGTVLIGSTTTQDPYPDGLLRLNGKRVESVIGNGGPLPSGALQLVARP